MAQLLSVDEWVKELSAIPERDFTWEHILDFIQNYSVQPSTLGPYLFFSLSNYTRNLIFRNDLFEALAICWEIGQASGIHNHRDQNCWMAAPIGRLRVQNYRVEDRNAAAGTCRLLPTDVLEIDADHPAAVNPVEPVHQVLNLRQFGQRAVTLHIYSRPFDSCEVYSIEKGTYADVPLHYTSVEGRLDPAEKLGIEK